MIELPLSCATVPQIIQLGFSDCNEIEKPGQHVGWNASRCHFPPGMHLCRGNFRSRWMAAGGYEPVAEKLFNATPVDAFLLEYDTERAGDFSPLPFVPKGKRVALGLVSSKTPEQEDQGQLLRRIEDAARYCPLEQLSLSAQCGFASRRRRQRANRGPAMGQAGAGRRHGTARLGSTIVADPYHRQAVGIEPVPLHPFWGMVLRVWLN
jgi:hypothetical protein